MAVGGTGGGKVGVEGGLERRFLFEVLNLHNSNS